jgi:hypothetical protein
MKGPATAPILPPAARGPATSPRRAWPAIAGWAALLTGVAGLLQLLTPVPWDADTAYHVAVGRLIAEHGILHAFPWTPFSWLAEHYADKELLFHLLLAPLAPLGWITAAKLAGALLGGAALLALYLVLRAEGVPRAGLWALLPLAASGAFVLRFALVRPHLLSIALALVVAWAVARERLRVVALASFLYPWAYIAWHLPLVLAGLAELARVLSGRRPAWRPLAVAAAAIAAGLAIHPNAMNLARFWWLLHVQILGRTAWAGSAGFELGREFEPFALAGLLRWVFVPAGLAAAGGVIAWRRRREDPAPLAFALAALAFLALTLASSRFIEYLAPFAAAAFALALGTDARRWAAAAVGGAFAFTAAFGAAPVLALGTRGDEIPPVFMQFLRDRVPPGAQVFTCDWGVTGELMLALPERRFIVALDPVLFFAKDPQLYRTWYALSREGPPDAAEVIRSRFGARWALCAARPESAPLLRRLARDPGVRTVLASRLWYLYDLGPARADAPRPDPGALP